MRASGRDDTFGWSRRRLLQTAAVAGSAAAAGCGADEAEDPGRFKTGPLVESVDDPVNPFGVDGEVPLDVVIFKGGYSDEYAVDGHQALYREKFPDAEIIHAATEQIEQAATPRFQAFAPPDVLMNAGGDAIPMDELAAQGQLLDLNVLLDAPSIDDPDTAVRDTLRPGVVEAGVVGGGDEVWGLAYAYSGYGLWYSQRLFDEHGWLQPQSWSEFMLLCDRALAEGLAPLAYPGQYADYMVDPIVTLAARHGGRDVADALESDMDSQSWGNESVLAALRAWEEFVSSGFVHEDAHNWSHREAQGEWAEGNAVFVPSGSWLENEESDEIPSGFELRFMPVPPLEGSVEPDLVQGAASNHFVVPAYATNPAGAMEYLRIMLSEAGTAAWVSNTAAPNAAAESVVTDEQPGFTSMQPYLEDESNVFHCDLQGRHGTFTEQTLGPAIKALLRGDADADEFVRRVADGL